jgi:hypothetical protein
MGNIIDGHLKPRKIFESTRANKIRKFIEEKKCSCSFECAVAASIVFNPKAQKRNN